MVTIPEDEYRASQGILAHYGTQHHSGRYPWGSGGDEVAQRNRTLLDEAEVMRKSGMREVDIAKGLGLTTTQLRGMKTVARTERMQDTIAMARNLAAKGMSNGAIAKQMRERGYDVKGESQVRNLLKDSQERKSHIIDNVADTLRKAVEKDEFIDVGAGVEYQLNITSTKLRSVLQKLKDEGYRVHSGIQLPQLGTNNKTTLKVLTKPGNEWGDVARNKENIKQVVAYSLDGGKTSLNMVYPKSISSSRVGIKYDEHGGSDADGTMYIRRGVEDVSLGKSTYAQVRVMVDGSHYIKGMAVYKDDLPPGVDILFNTNKKDTGNKLDALKELKKNEVDGEIDKDNPFGASIKRQLGERDPVTGEMKKLTSVMNIVNDEGDWDKWSSTLSSQMLSKQQPALAKEQLAKALEEKHRALKEIMATNNPAVKKTLLKAFSDGADSASVHLKAAALPRQKTQVLLPIKAIKENEVYAPGFNNGERVALIRFPHGGTFEIPQLTVNNNNPAGQKLLGPKAKDAIGIHPKVAERLSGADFDGDAVLVVPNNLGKVKSSAALAGLQGFNPKDSYPPYEGMKRMTDTEKGFQMGLVSNLITDMTIRRAGPDEIARAVRHSMVVIDAEKHNLDFRRSAKENGISALMAKYQNSSQGGASTLVSRATSRQDVLERKERSSKDGGPIDPITGKKVYTNTERSRTYTDENGKEHVRLSKMQSVKLAETDDAHTLSSGTVMEAMYADHSNALKGLANKARKDMVAIKDQSYNSSARKTHAAAYETLTAKLETALKNAPLERQAQVFANAVVRMKKQANPSLTTKEGKSELKRVKSQALAAARARTGADKQAIDITDTEWAAIQAGAITKHKLEQILLYADLDKVKALATPKPKQAVNSAQSSKAKALLAQGYTWAEVSQSIGIPVSTIKAALEGGDSD